jgi:hypothetical protein
MQDYEAAGHMKPVQPQLKNDSVCYYLPHHSVFKATSTTTKKRVVFDAGANSSTWPARDFKPTTEDLEIKKTLVAGTTPKENIKEGCSKLSRLTRDVAYCKRFIYNCRQAKTHRETTSLTAQELASALTCCINLVQKNSNAQEIEDLTTLQEVSNKSSLKSLHPFLDQQGIIRGGRLQQSTIPYQAIHQVIFPSNSHLTKLIVTSEHIRLHHAGPQLLIASLRERYWII